MMENHEHGQRKTKNFSKYKLIYDALWVKEAVSYDKSKVKAGFVPDTLLHIKAGMKCGTFQT